MLSDRIISTIKFFDLQDYPLTSFEVWRYLVSDIESLRKDLDEHFELIDGVEKVKPVPVHFDTVLSQLDNLCQEGKLGRQLGFYFLPERKILVAKRLTNYRYGLKREKLIRRYLKFARHLPFVRGISLAGSQALGLKRPTSDIDLFILTDEKFMWFARTFLTAYFQILGVRRHGAKIANRFCLNHYLATIREVDTEKNLYKAIEYAKLRSVVYPQNIFAFQKINEDWMKMFLPNLNFETSLIMNQSMVQRIGEWCMNHKFGLWLEAKLGKMQLTRIKQDKYIFVKDDELSFHPESKHEILLKGLFQEGLN